ncbi:MAG: hypothetical protein HQ569_03050, partial [Actinobacteria bacterium]|nr:hypothetical protein [Actinomycetota bacterium]
MFISSWLISEEFRFAPSLLFIWEAIIARYKRQRIITVFAASAWASKVPESNFSIFKTWFVGRNSRFFPSEMIAEIYGKETGCSHGKGGSMHLIDIGVNFMGSTAIVGGTIPLSVGLGLSIKLKKTDQISCVFFGDAAIEEGVFYESVNFAVLKKLPVLFICENN